MSRFWKAIAVIVIAVPLWYLAWEKWQERRTLEAWVEWRNLLAKYPGTMRTPREIDAKSPADAARFDALYEKYRRQWRALGYDRD
jgi:hypothetical protein